MSKRAKPNGREANTQVHLADSGLSKRKLTRRQLWRIEKIQQERQKRAQQRDQQTASRLHESDLGSEQDGLIVTHFGTQVLVEAADGTSKRCHFRSNLGGLVTGDQVAWRDANPYGVVVAVQPRRSALMRPDPYGDLKVVAANIDRIAVIIAPHPEPHCNLIDRYLVAASAIDIEPVIVINKVDTLQEQEQQQRQTIDKIDALYRHLGYQVIRTSARTESGLKQLRGYLAHFTSVFVGQSGVGKSSLVNALLPEANMRVGELSDNHRGTHTTTSARLFHIPSGGQLIDSPGIREFGLWHMDADTSLNGFREFRPFIGHCKFRDCTHTQEPGCAILKALEEGDISPERLASYRRILAEFNPRAPLTR